MNKKAFSFVEIIIAVSILAILAIIATTANNNIKNNSYNTKVISDMGTIESALISFSEAGNTLASPDGNNNNFSSSGSYVHDYDDAFGTYGKFSEDTLAKMYLDSTPLDPRTNQYYSYGITRESNQFEIAGVIYDKESDTYSAKVVGNYTAENGPYNLIKEYNGNSFVTNKGSHLPYNPYERVLVATDTNGNVYIQGDTIENNSGSELEIYFSDGSVSIIEDGTTIVLTEASFPSDTNLSSNISLFLQAGTIWTKASRLDKDSNFDVFTTDTSTSVRGTIFAVSTDGTKTTITLDNGELALYTMTDLGDGEYDTTPITKSDYSGLTTNTDGEDVLSSDGSSSTSVVIDANGISNTTSNITIDYDLFSEADFELEVDSVEESDSGDYKEKVEEEVGNKSCYIAGTQVADGDTFIGYLEESSVNCSSKTRVCENGIFTDGHDSYVYTDCSEPNKCSENYIYSIDGTTYTGHKSGGTNIGDYFFTDEDIDIENGYYTQTIKLSCDSSLDYTSTQQAISLSSIVCDNSFYTASLTGSSASCTCNTFEIDGVCQTETDGDYIIAAYAPYSETHDSSLYYNGGEKGINQALTIDSAGAYVTSGEYLVYNDIDSIIDSSDDFILEMEVFFASSLPSSASYLFQLGDFKSYLYTDGRIKVRNGNTSINREHIDLTNTPSSNENIYNDAYHTIKVKRESYTSTGGGSTYKYYIYIDGTEEGSFESTNNIGTNLYLGSNSSNSLPLNNYIKYFKIFK